MTDDYLSPERIHALVNGIAVGSGRTRAEFNDDLEALGTAASVGDHLTIMEADDLDGLAPDRIEHLDDCHYCRRLVEAIYRPIDVTNFDRKLEEELAIPRRTLGARLAFAATMFVSCLSGVVGTLVLFERPAIGASVLGPRTPPQLTISPRLSKDPFKVGASRTLDIVTEEYFRTQVPYGMIIYREARKNDLSPELVAAMVHTDSDFRPQLVSDKSAQGLMQIVPETARVLGVTNPFDPEQNIAAGTKYFRYLLDQYDNPEVALAAYNTGIGTVAKYGGIPPYQETRTYLEQVNRRAGLYHERVRRSHLAGSKLHAVAR